MSEDTGGDGKLPYASFTPYAIYRGHPTKPRFLAALGSLSSTASSSSLFCIPKPSNRIPFSEFQGRQNGFVSKDTSYSGGGPISSLI